MTILTATHTHSATYQPIEVKAIRPNYWQFICERTVEATRQALVAPARDPAAAFTCSWSYGQSSRPDGRWPHLDGA